MDVEKRAEEIINDPNLNDFDNSMVDAIAALVREAVAEEREACAQAAEDSIRRQDEDLRKMGLPTTGDAMAAAIRARSPRKEVDA